MFKTQVFKTCEKLTRLLILISLDESLHKLEMEPKLASYLRFSRPYLRATLTSNPLSRNCLLNFIVSSQGSTTGCSNSLNLYFLVLTPMRHCLPWDPPSLEVLIPLSHQGSKICLAHPLSCGISLPRGIHHVLRPGHSNSLFLEFSTR